MSTTPGEPLHGAFNPSDTAQQVIQRLNAVGKDFNLFFEHLKYVILIPLSWWLTLSHFVLGLIWGIWSLPLRIAVNFYERQVRRAFPWLPSILGTLNTLFPEGIKLPTLTSLTAGPYKGAGPTGPGLPTLDNTEFDAAIVNGGAGGVNGVGNGNDSSPIESSRSNLETALKKIPATSPIDLNARLADVKAAQAETEKALESLAVSS